MVTINTQAAKEIEITQAISDNWVRVSDLFKAMDTDGNGVVDKKEFRLALKHLGIHAKRHEIDDIFEKWDADGSGELDFGELNRALRVSIRDAKEQERKMNDAKERGDAEEVEKSFKKAARGTTVVGLWAKIVARTNEIYCTVEKLRPTYAALLSTLLEQESLPSELLQMGPLKDPVRVHTCACVHACAWWARSRIQYASPRKHRACICMRACTCMHAGAPPREGCLIVHRPVQ